MVVSTAPRISEERRCHMRFPLQLGAECAFYKGRAPVTIKCTGTVQNLSAGGCCLILIEPARIDVGMIAQLRIAWPAKFQDNIAMQFRTFGRVLRVDGPLIAVSIQSYEFRLQGKPRLAMADA